MYMGQPTNLGRLWNGLDNPFKTRRSGGLLKCQNDVILTPYLSPKIRPLFWFFFSLIPKSPSASLSKHLSRCSCCPNNGSRSQHSIVPLRRIGPPPTHGGRWLPKTQNQPKISRNKVSDLLTSNPRSVSPKLKTKSLNLSLKFTVSSSKNPHFHRVSNSYLRISSPLPNELNLLEASI